MSINLINLDNSDNNNNSESESNDEDDVIQRSHKFNLWKNPRSKTKNLSENVLQFNKKANVNKTSKRFTKFLKSTKLIQSTQSSTDTTKRTVESTLKKICKAIYKSLLHYWNEPNEIGLIVTILDPCFKDLNFLSIEKKDDIENKLIGLYADLENENTNDL